MFYQDVSASALSLLLQFLYTGELPAWEGRGLGGGGAEVQVGPVGVAGREDGGARAARAARRAQAAKRGTKDPASPT